MSPARSGLCGLEGSRRRFRATVGRSGCCLSGETLLILDIQYAATGEPAADHVWTRRAEWPDELTKGDVVEFDATIDIYRRGYLGKRDEVAATHPVSHDWRITRVGRVVVLHRACDHERQWA